MDIQGARKKLHAAALEIESVRKECEQEGLVDTAAELELILESLKIAFLGFGS